MIDCSPRRRRARDRSRVRMGVFLAGDPTSPSSDRRKNEGRESGALPTVCLKRADAARPSLPSATVVSRARFCRRVGRQHQPRDRSIVRTSEKRANRARTRGFPRARREPLSLSRRRVTTRGFNRNHNHARVGGGGARSAPRSDRPIDRSDVSDRTSPIGPIGPIATRPLSIFTVHDSSEST